MNLLVNFLLSYYSLCKLHDCMQVLKKLAEFSNLDTNMIMLKRSLAVILKLPDFSSLSYKITRSIIDILSTLDFQ